MESKQGDAVSAPQWTPGPYSVESIVRCDGDTDYETLRIVSADARFGGIIATMTGDAQTGLRTNTAHLLAAAPELAEALRYMCGLLGDASSHCTDTANPAYGDCLKAYNAARAALAKAEGRA